MKSAEQLEQDAPEEAQEDDEAAPDEEAASEPVRREVQSLDRYESLQADLLSFTYASNATDDEKLLAADIVELDHRSLHAFGVRSEQRAEVKALLINAIVLGRFSFGSRAELDAREPGSDAASKELVRRAHQAYRRHLQADNRLTYVAGMFIAVVFVATASGLSLLVHGSNQTVQVLPWLLVCAGMGSICSVLTRLSSLDLSHETSRKMLLLSGASRPITASFFAVAAYLALAGGLVSIGNGADPKIYFVAAFLCGFSERFVQDFFGRFEPKSTTPAEPPSEK